MNSKFFIFYIGILSIVIQVDVIHFLLKIIFIFLIILLIFFISTSIKNNLNMLGIGDWGLGIGDGGWGMGVDGVFVMCGGELQITNKKKYIIIS